MKLFPSRRREGQEAADQAAGDQAAAVEEYTVVPASSFNVMTTRYRRRRNANLILFGIVGVLVAGILGLTYLFYSTQLANNEVLTEIAEAKIDIELLKDQITQESNTAGLDPDQVSRHLSQRQAAFLAATRGKVDYARILTDFAAIPVSGVEITAMDFSTGEEGEVTVNITARATNNETAVRWRQALSVAYPYVASVSPAEMSAGDGSSVGFSVTAELTNAVLFDAASYYGFVIPEDVSPSTGKEEKSDEQVAEADEAGEDTHPAEMVEEAP